METTIKYPGLQQQPDSGERLGLARRIVKKFLRAQYGKPTGLIGQVAGLLMAQASSNRERIDWTVSLLDIKPTDRVLEIGMGPGVAAERINRMVPRGHIVGVDHSEVMVRQAAKRNAAAVKQGRVQFLVGSASQLPEFSEPFDKIFSINSIHFWNDPVSCLAALHGLLKPGGTIAVTLQPRSRSATKSTTEELGREVQANLERAGFANTRLEIGTMKPVGVACALGFK